MKEAADEVGGLNKLADLIGIPRRTLGDQIAKTEPKLSLVIETAKATGYAIEWLATGKGPRKSTGSRPIGGSKELADAWGATMTLLKDALAKVYQEEGVSLPPVAFLDELIRRYAALLPSLADPHDVEEMKAQLPAVEYRLRKELREAKAAPGTGKREAS